ncbi:hypothetical protein A5761_26905 [Mycolicibacterium setense]|nr:hypothetical protein A5761_26905 [Mycolicibacterium setense]
MAIDTEALMSAWSEGRTAKLRAANPYCGQRQLARMWMLGYKRMLRERLDRSPARQKYLARERVIAEFVARNGYRPAAVDRHLRE